MPTYLFKHTGSAAATGIIMGSAVVLTLIFRPYIGKKIKKKGAKNFILLGLTGSLLGTLLFPFFTDFTLLLFARVIQGSGLILFFFSSLIMVSRMIPDSRRGELFGIYTIVFIFPLIFAPVLGTFLEREFSFKSAAFSASGLIIVSFLFSIFIDEKKSKQSPESVSSSTIKDFFRPSVRTPLVLVFFLIFTDAGIITFLPLAAENFNIDNFALYFSLFALSSIATRLLFGKSFDRLPRKYVIGGGTLLSITGIILLTRFTLVFLLAAGVIYGIGYGFTDSNLLPCLMARMKDNSKESAIIAYSIVFDFAYLIAPPVLGFLGDRTGFRILYILCAFVILISSILFMISPERSEHDLS